MFIHKLPSPNVSAECKHYSHAVACYHRYRGIQLRTHTIRLQICTSKTVGKHVCFQFAIVRPAYSRLLPRCRAILLRFAAPTAIS